MTHGGHTKPCMREQGVRGCGCLDERQRCLEGLAAEIDWELQRMRADNRAHTRLQKVVLAGTASANETRAYEEMTRARQVPHAFATATGYATGPARLRPSDSAPNVGSYGRSAYARMRKQTLMDPCAGMTRNAHEARREAYTQAMIRALPLCDACGYTMKPNPLEETMRTLKDQFSARLTRDTSKLRSTLADQMAVYREKITIEEHNLAALRQRELEHLRRVELYRHTRDPEKNRVSKSLYNVAGRQVTVTCRYHDHIVQPSASRYTTASYRKEPLAAATLRTLSLGNRFVN